MTKKARDIENAIFGFLRKKSELKSQDIRLLEVLNWNISVYIFNTFSLKVSYIFSFSFLYSKLLEWTITTFTEDIFFFFISAQYIQNQWKKSDLAWRQNRRENVFVLFSNYTIIIFIAQNNIHHMAHDSWHGKMSRQMAPSPNFFGASPPFIVKFYSKLILTLVKSHG